MVHGKYKKYKGEKGSSPQGRLVLNFNSFLSISNENGRKQAGKPLSRFHVHIFWRKRDQNLKSRDRKRNREMRTYRNGQARTESWKIKLGLCMYKVTHTTIYMYENIHLHTMCFNMSIRIIGN